MKAFVAVSSLLGLAAADPIYAPIAPVLAKSYPSWPGVVGPGFESTCYGCGLGKRSADAEPEAFAPLGLWGPGIAAHPTGISYSNRSPQGAYGKRSAEPWAPVWGPGIAAHPTGISYSNRSPQGAYGKRSAEPWAPVWGPGIAAHPTGISYSNRSPQGAYGKRSAEPLGYGLGYAYGVAPGVNAHPTGVSYSSVRLGKRDAEPALLAPALPKAYPSWPGVVAPGFESTCYGCGLGKRSADADAEPLAISYSNRSPQGAYGWGPAPYIWG